MSRLILVCGQTGAGKTTYSLKLSDEIKAIRFSIDPWMQRLFSKDMKSLDFSWMVERVKRCHEQIWEVSNQILKHKGSVILDLAFTTKKERSFFIEKSKHIGIKPEIHLIEIPSDIRRKRVQKRNSDRDPDLYSFEVTSQMFNFMEPRFEKPESEELMYVTTVEPSL